MKVTYYGHACFSVELCAKHILFDPFVSPNPLAEHIALDDIQADYILISHGHEDHVADAKVIAKRTGATVVSNFEIVNWFASKGVENGHPMNIGGSWQFDFGTVKYVNAVHSSVMPDGSYGGNPGGFIIDSKEGCFYFAGDTALTMDMQLIGRQFNLDFAVLPIGDNFTMGADDAVIAAEFVGCNQVLGVHYDTFGYIKVDREEAMRKFQDKGISLHLLEIGQNKEF